MIGELRRAVVAAVRFRRGRDVAWAVGPLALYCTLQVWILSRDSLWPFTVATVLLVTSVLTVHAVRTWDQAGGVVRLRTGTVFLCREGDCDVRYTHVDQGRVIAYANQHLAEVHRVEAPDWDPSMTGPPYWPPYVCPHCRDEFDEDDREEGSVTVTEDGIVCSMCEKAGRNTEAPPAD